MVGLVMSWTARHGIYSCPIIEITITPMSITVHTFQLYTGWAKFNGANAVSFVVVKHVLEFF